VAKGPEPFSFDLEVKEHRTFLEPDGKTSHNQSQVKTIPVPSRGLARMQDSTAGKTHDGRL
jgi:hypothetical protein